MNRKYIVIVGICLILAACQKKERIDATLLPLEEGSTLVFRGYVTDDEEELVGPIHDFTREFSHIDTIEGVPVFGFYSDDEKEYFYRDEAGTVRQLATVNLTNRLIPHGIRTDEPVLIRYWDTLYNTEDGFGTEWTVSVDTTIAARDSTGSAIEVRYYYHAAARLEGWDHAAIPESQSYQRVLHVNWYDVENFILNVTDSDSLFVRKGRAHSYFDPELGLIKYITDYKLKDRRNYYVSRHGTWELTEKRIPAGS